MPTDIKWRVNLAIIGSNNDDRFVADLVKEVIAPARDTADMANIDPVFLEDFLHLQVEDCLIGVEGLLQRPARPAPANHLKNITARLVM